jgi:hypothetical protein
VAWWRGEAATGSVVSDIIGGHNGGFFSGNAAANAVYTPDGKVGTAFVFDGTSLVPVPYTLDLRLDEITVEAWVFPTVLSGGQTIIARGSSTNDDDAWWMGVLDGKPRFWSKHVGLPTPM